MGRRAFCGAARKPAGEDPRRMGGKNKMSNNRTATADVLRLDRTAECRFEGDFAGAVEFIMQHQLMKPELWKKFVQIFRVQPDAGGYWRGEYWGKMMRGAAWIYRYTRNEELYRMLRASVCDLIGAAEPCGRISSYVREQEFRGWDMWCRKYVLLGLQYFSEICPEPELRAQIQTAMERHLDYIINKVGDGEGQIPLEHTSKAWESANSCSILEPVLRLWHATGKAEYLAFADYIVRVGASTCGKSIFELAYRDELPPFRYPVVKAYEVMSCFEGLVEYYRITGEEKWKTAALNFGRRIRETEVTAIGCCGCTHELFDHSAWRQTGTDYRGIMQETCVTVTWMKLSLQLLRLSGDAAYADCIEQSFCNAYLGSLNTRLVPSRSRKRNEEPKPGQEPIPTVLPFDSYSPLLAGARGDMVGGYQLMPDHSFYGCCACIGAAGAGMIPQAALLRTDDGLALNLYLPGSIRTRTPGGQELTLDIRTGYPYDGTVRVRVSPARPERFPLLLRIPAWSEQTSLTCAGTPVAVDAAGYLTLDREWTGQEIELVLDMRVVRQAPPAGACNEDRFLSYRRGPLMLAADARLGRDPDSAFPVAFDENGVVAGTAPAECPEIPEARLCLSLPTADGGALRLIDYASAGKTWESDSRCAVWMSRE